MPKSRAWRRSAQRGGAGSAIRSISRARPVPSVPALSREAKARLDMLDWHDRQGRCVARTARHFGFSRPTLYRWLARYDRHRLESLEDRSSRPHHRRRPDLDAGGARRRAAGAPGLSALMARTSSPSCSAAKAWSSRSRWSAKILERLRATGELREPTHRRISALEARLAAAARCAQAAATSRPSTRATWSRSIRSTCARCRGRCSSSSRRVTSCPAATSSNWRALPAPARRSRSSTPWRPGCRSGSGPSASTTVGVHGRASSSVCRARDRPVHAAAAQPQAQRLGRAG